jgi:prefoldin alpha subunit
MSEKESRQGKLVMYQLLQAELEELKRQALMVESRMIELGTTEHALSEMEGLVKGDALIPLGSGCYAHSSIKGPWILLDIGAGVMVRRSMGSARTFLEERRAEIEKVGKNLQKQMEGVARSINELTPEIEKIITEARKGD